MIEGVTSAEVRELAEEERLGVEKVDEDDAGSYRRLLRGGKICCGDRVLWGGGHGGLAGEVDRDDRSSKAARPEDEEEGMS
jgi:hypothetical protein